MATSRPITRTPTNAWGPLPPHATPPRRRGVLHWLERLLLVIGVVCVGYYGYVSAETALYQAWETRELDKILASVPTAPAPDAADEGPVVERSSVPALGSTVGRLEIPRLGISAIVRYGADARTLSLAVGHIPGTPLPGEGGNVGLAAHRDTFFRRLGEIRPDDEVRLVAPEGTFVYHVDGTKVVEPTDVWVLGATARPAITLVTCYPFSYVGSAPQRFIVRASLAKP